MSSHARLIKEHRNLAQLFRAYLQAPQKPSPAMAELAISQALTWGCELEPAVDAGLAQVFSTFRPDWLDKPANPVNQNTGD